MVSSNTIQRFPKFILAASIAFHFVTVVHADDEKQKPSVENKTSLHHALRLHIDIVEVASEVLTTTTDQKPSTPQIVNAVRSAVKTGKGRVRYTLETPITVNTPLSLIAGAREPIVASQKTTTAGRRATNVQYDEVGCTIDLHSKLIGSVPEEGVFMRWEVEMSDFRPSGVQLEGDLESPRFVQETFASSAIAVPGETIAFRVGVQRGNTDDARIIIVIATLTETEAGSSKK